MLFLSTPQISQNFSIVKLQNKVWNIQMLLKQHDYCTDVAWAVHNKRPLLISAFLAHNKTPKLFQVLRECGIGMLAAGMYIRGCAHELNELFLPNSITTPQYV